MTALTIQNLQTVLKSPDSFKIENNIIVKRWAITQFFLRLFGLAAKKECELASFVEKFLATTEVSYKDLSCPLFGGEATQKEIKAIVSSMKERLSKYKHSKPAIQWRRKLEREHVAYTYRTNNKGTPVRKKDVQWLKKEISAWKGKQFPPLSSDLSPYENRKILSTCRHKNFVDLLREDPALFHEYCRFVFRNLGDSCKDSVQIFIKFPHIAERLTSSHLDKRVHVVGNKGLTCKKNDVTILIEGKPVSLKDDRREIRFQDGSVSSLNTILNNFRDSEGYSDYEYYEQGILNVGPRNLRLNLADKDNWWKGIPAYKTLKQNEVEKRYKTKLGENQPLITFMASRGTDKTLRVDQSHGWVELAIPRENGTYSIIPFGKRTHTKPTTALDKIAYVFSTRRGSIVLDTEPFYLHLQRTGFPVPISGKQLNRCLETVRKDLISSENGEEFFQAQGDNCATWAQHIFEETCKDHPSFIGSKLPKLYKVDILKTTMPSAFLNFLTSIFHFISKWISPQAAHASRVGLSILFGASKTYQCKGKKITLSHNINWITGELNLPAQLFHNVDGLRAKYFKN